MAVKLTHASRTELADSLRQRYQSSSGKTKKLILREFIASTGYHPKYALQLLNAEDAALPKRPQTRNRLSLYDDAARQALIVLWESSERICGKRLQPLLRILLPALERHGHLVNAGAFRLVLTAAPGSNLSQAFSAIGPVACRTPSAASDQRRWASCLSVCDR